MPSFPLFPAGEGGGGGLRSPRELRRGCWGAGPEQGLKPERQSPPWERTPPRPGRRKHPETPARARGAEPGVGHRPRVPPHGGSTARSSQAERREGTTGTFSEMTVKK